MPTRISPVLFLSSFLLGPTQPTATAASDIKEAAAAADEIGKRLKAGSVGPLKISTRGYSGEIQFSAPKEGVEVSVASVEIDDSGLMDVVYVKVDVTQAVRMKLDIVPGAFSHLPDKLQKVDAEGLVTIRVFLKIERSGFPSGPFVKAKARSVELRRVSWVLSESPKGVTSENRSGLARLLSHATEVGFAEDGGEIIEKLDAALVGRQPATK